MNRKRKRSKSKYQKHNKGIYAVSVFAIIALVGVAFFSPGWVFGLQDSRQYSDTVLEERENVDVAVLSTNYESSFYQRMVNFAEGRMNHTNFYVTSEELTDYQELGNFLNSESGLYGDSIQTLLDAHLISEFIYNCEIRAWKQYVIYSDDYAKGVNFILWYIELAHPYDEPGIGTYKLLVEANTGELYGLHADMGGTQISYDGYGKLWNINANKYSLADVLGFTSLGSYNEAYQMLAYYYSGLAETDFFQYCDLLYEPFYSAVSELSQDSVSIDGLILDASELAYAYGYAEIQEKTGIEVSKWMEFFRTNAPLLLVWDDGNRLECTFPYGESEMVFRLQMAESVSQPWTLRDLTIGFPAIYSLIPEFE